MNISVLIIFTILFWPWAQTHGKRELMHYENVEKPKVPKIYFAINGEQLYRQSVPKYNSGEYLQIECYTETFDRNYVFVPIVYLSRYQKNWKSDIVFEGSSKHKFNVDLLLSPLYNEYFLGCAVIAKHKQYAIDRNDYFYLSIQLIMNMDSNTEELTEESTTATTPLPTNITTNNTLVASTLKKEDVYSECPNGAADSISTWFWISVTYNVIGTIAIVLLIKMKLICKPNMVNQNEGPAPNNITSNKIEVNTRESSKKIKKDKMTPNNTEKSIYSNYSNPKPTSAENNLHYASLELKDNPQVKNIKRNEAVYINISRQKGIEPLYTEIVKEVGK